MADLGELHRRYDGFIPRDEIDRADGLDPALMEALGRVKFWRERVWNAATAVDRGRYLGAPRVARLVAGRDSTVAAYKRALAHLRLVRDPATAATAEIVARIGRRST